MNIESYLQDCQQRMHIVLDDLLSLSSHTESVQLQSAIRYAVLNGGKRMRSAFIFAVGEALGAKTEDLEQLSAAIEMIHAGSLVLDDLPALDNDDLRRGKPSCHKAFPEGVAILAGDALQILGIETIAQLKETNISSAIKIEMIKIITHAIGNQGMMAGEELDIQMSGNEVTLAALEHTYILKTSYLFIAGVLLGALAANCTDQDTLTNLKQFGHYLGLAFQIHDDIIGEEFDTHTLGKPQHSDDERQKPTYPSLIGIEAARQKAKEAFDYSIECLRKSNIPSEKIEAIAQYAIARNH